MQKLPVSKLAHGNKMPSARKSGPGRYHLQGLKRPAPKGPLA